MKYWAIRCPCGANAFRASGWPLVASGSGNQFWRTLARIWREARHTTLDGEPVDPPFALPLFLQCDECGRNEELFAGVDWAAHDMPNDESKPREAYRCRGCRRARVEVVVGVARRGEASSGNPERRSDSIGDFMSDPNSDANSDPNSESKEASDDSPETLEFAATEVVVNCRACLRDARIAWGDWRPTHQQVRLDTLYGRR